MRIMPTLSFPRTGGRHGWFASMAGVMLAISQACAQMHAMDDPAPPAARPPGTLHQEVGQWHAPGTLRVQPSIGHPPRGVWPAPADRIDTTIAAGPRDATSQTGHDVLEPAPPGSFTVVVIPDTQDYADGGSPSGDLSGQQVFHAITQWIVDHREEQRIVFVSHVGDVVNRVSAREEWVVAREAMDRLHGVLPYGISPGNHDMNTRTGSKPLFEEFFGADRYAAFEWYGGTLDNNANSYQLVSAEGLDLLFLHLECNAPDHVLDWAGTILETHADRRAIVTTHMWLGPVEHWGKNNYNDMPKGRMQWSKCHRNDHRGNSPQQMWDKRISLHPNVMMILCGDQRSTQALRRQTVGLHDNMVHELLCDIRDGYVRLMRFYPAENRIDVRTYSPTLKRLCDGTAKTMAGPRQPIGIVTDLTQHHFSLSHDLRTP